MRKLIYLITLLLSFKAKGQFNIQLHGGSTISAKEVVFKKSEITANLTDSLNSDLKIIVFNKAAVIKIIQSDGIVLINNQILKIKSSDLEIEKMEILLEKQKFDSQEKSKLAISEKDKPLIYQISPISYTEVIHVEGISKEELYKRAKIWFVKTFVSSKEVLELDDKENGQLIGHGSLRNYSLALKAADGVVNYVVELYIKDGRYKYTIGNFVHKSVNDVGFGLITNSPNNPVYDKFFKRLYDSSWQEIQDNVKREAMTLQFSLNRAMKTRTESQKEDW